MRTLGWLFVAAMVAASTVEAGGPPGRGDRGQPGRGDRGGFGRGGPFGDRTRRTDLFDVARRAFELADATRVAVGDLRVDYGIAERYGIAEIRRRLSKEYILKILPLLPDEEKPKAEKALAAMLERDEAIATAQKALQEALSEAEKACRKKVVEALGQEKADAILGGGSPPRRPAPGAPAAPAAPARRGF